MSVTSLREKILPTAFNKNGSKFVECELESGQEMGEQFQSNVVFITVVLSNDDVITKVPVVVKFEPANRELWAFLNTPQQFHNEVLMYREILPFLERHDIVKNTFPKFYYGSSNIEDPASDVLMIQDLRQLGFKLTQEKAFISHEHISTAVRKLGKFHALSYAAKRQSPEEFRSLISGLKETSWMYNTEWSPMLTACIRRATDPLIAQGKHVQVLERLMSLINHKLVPFVKSLVNPEEPMAVICHGDFCRNNVLYKYGVGDTPSDVMFFDVATARYSSPVIDLAFNIFLNSSKEVREANLDHWLREYHDALSTAVPGTEVPSLEDIKEDFKQRAVYGFLHCSFFLPMMLYERPYDTLDETVGVERLDDPEPWQAQLGGEEGTLLLADLMAEIVDRGFLTLHHKIFS